MSQLVFVNDSQVFTDSLTVAEVFGKRHDAVLRDIRNLECSEEFNLHNFAEIDYTDERNRTYKKYLIKRDGLAFLVFGYTGAKAAEYKEKYIQAFNAMEEELRKPKVLTDKEQLIASIKLTIEHEEKFNEYDGRLSKLEDNVRIDSFEQNALQKQIKKRVYKVFETANPNGLDLKKLFPCIHRNFRDAFGVPTYRDLRKLDYEEAVSWVSTWRPLI